MVSSNMDEVDPIDAHLKSLRSSAPEKAKAVEAYILTLKEDLAVTHDRLEQVSRELARVNGVLKDSEKKRNEMISICAHDLKSPTSSILSFLDILRSSQHRLPAHEIEKVYDRMERAGRHMWSLVNDLLDTNQIESGKIQLQKQAVLLSQLAREVVDHSAAKAEAKEIKLLLEVEPAELKVSMDQQKGMQIVNNLLSNALKFTPRGGQVICHVSTKNNKSTLKVIDSGQGIPKEEIEKIFEKFKQTSTRSTEGEKGSGLGLSIVQQLVSLHHGEIGVESKLGKGTTFSITFPVAESPVLLKLFSGKR